MAEICINKIDCISRRMGLVEFITVCFFSLYVRVSRKQMHLVWKEKLLYEMLNKDFRKYLPTVRMGSRIITV